MIFMKFLKFFDPLILMEIKIFFFFNYNKN
jgi:hypothetical protein